MTIPNPDPLVPWDYDQVWQDGHDTGVDDGWSEGFRSGVRIRPIVAAGMVAIAIVAGFLLATAAHAAPRSAATAIPTVGPELGSTLTGPGLSAASGNLSQPTRAPLDVSPPAPAPTSGPLLGPAQGRRGIIAYATIGGPSYLAIPIGPGHRVKICGPAACWTTVSTDAGPNHDMLVIGRIADVAQGHWRTICGPEAHGTCRGYWSVVDGPTTTPPATDVEP